jgi:hypothetical protein
VRGALGITLRGALGTTFGRILAWIFVICEDRMLNA